MKWREENENLKKKTAHICIPFLFSSNAFSFYHFATL